MSRALVLNASYEPLSVVTGRRAAVLVLTEKAVLEHVSGLLLHSERLVLPVPSVVRLRAMVHARRHHTAALSRRAVFARDRHTCQYCGAHAETIDHVVPRSRGGPHAWDNVVAACRRCNLRKGDRLPEEKGMHLHQRPVPAKPHTWVLTTVEQVPEEWQPYIVAA